MIDRQEMFIALAYMANQIAGFFRHQPHEEAVTGIAGHISDFWEPRMRAQFFGLMENEPERFDPLVVEAAPKVRAVADHAGVRSHPAAAQSGKYSPCHRHVFSHLNGDVAFATFPGPPDHFTTFVRTACDPNGR